MGTRMGSRSILKDRDLYSATVDRDGHRYTVFFCEAQAAETILVACPECEDQHRPIFARTTAGRRYTRELGFPVPDGFIVERCERRGSTGWVASALRPVAFRVTRLERRVANRISRPRFQHHFMGRSAAVEGAWCWFWSDSRDPSDWDDDLRKRAHSHVCDLWGIPKEPEVTPKEQMDDGI